MRVEVPFTVNDIAFKITPEIDERKHQLMLYVLLRVVSALLGIIIIMSFHCREMSLQWFFTVNSPVIFLKYTFEFVFNMARSASKGVCRTNCRGKGLKLKTFYQTHVIILSSLLVRRSHMKLKMPGSNPS